MIKTGHPKTEASASITHPAAYQLCGLGQVAGPSFASVSLSGKYYLLHSAAVSMNELIFLSLSLVY